MNHNTEKPKCCELCRPNSLERKSGLDTCRITTCGCHFQPKKKCCQFCLKGSDYEVRECYSCPCQSHLFLKSYSQGFQDGKRIGREEGKLLAQNEADAKVIDAMLKGRQEAIKEVMEIVDGMKKHDCEELEKNGVCGHTHAFDPYYNDSLSDLKNKLLSLIQNK